VLNDGAIHNGQHLLGHRFCGGQKAGAKASDGEDGFADALRRGWHIG
jgi:hypothetical protein